MKHFRNGDWTIKEISKEEKDRFLSKAELMKHKGEVIFAEGEATGHFHKAIVKDKKDMTFHKMPDGSYLVSLHDEATITHPEHSEKVDLHIPVGDYVFYKRREKDWISLATRKVID